MAMATEVAPAQPGPPPVPSQVVPMAPKRFAIQFTIDESTHDKLRHVQELLSHSVPSGDLAQVFDRALDAIESQARETEIRGDFKASGEFKQATLISQSPPHPGAREARGQRARPRPVHIRERDGSALHFAQVARVRPHRPGRARGPLDGGERSTPVSGPQRPRGGSCVRGRLHGTEAEGGQARRSRDASTGRAQFWRTRGSGMLARA